jgi:hypothetical protein
VKTSRRQRAKREEHVLKVAGPSRDLRIFALLTAAVFAAYRQVLRFGFVN